jgi:hypothetical protein
MSTKLKFQRACKLIPSAENLETRTFILSGGDLYFGGDRSWFKIEDFMDSDIDVYLEMKDLHPIISMEGDVIARKGTSGRPERTLVTFSNGKHTLNLFCDGNNVEPPKSAVPLLAQEYESLPPMFTRGRNMFSLITDFATAGIVTVDAGNNQEEGYFAVLNQKMFVALQGDPGLDIDLTDIPEVIGGVIAQGAKIKMDNQIVHCMIEDDNYTIYSAFKHAKSRFMNKQKSFIAELGSGEKEKDPNPSQPLIRMSASVQQILEAIPIMDKLSHEGYVTMEVDKSKKKMRMSLVDKMNNTFETFIDCDSSEDAKLTALALDTSTLNALCTAVNVKQDEAMLKMFLNPWTKYLFMRVEPNEDNVNMFTLVKTI